MRLKSIELTGFKSFARKTELTFSSAITAIVGPNGSGKSNTAESFRFVLGEQSMRSMRGRRGEDMIWNGSATVPRAGRASVKLVFDNTDRKLDLDFDEVSIERVVYRDGGNDYLLNGSSVRLRDIAELLAQANIGASGHHIISQGEADRILSASSREKREMLEDALGLTAFLYKREEAQKKLLKTAENVREVESLRRELAPHLRFLQSQVRKIEESQKLRDTLTQQYLEYLHREDVFVKFSLELSKEAFEAPEQEYAALSERIVHLRQELSQKVDDARSLELMRLEGAGRDAVRKREALTRELGRLEGELAAHARVAHVVASAVPGEQVREFIERIETELQEVLVLGEQERPGRISALIILAKDFLRRIMQRVVPEGTSPQELEARKKELEAELVVLAAEEARIADAVAALRMSIENEKDASRAAEKELFTAMSRRSEVETQLARLRGEADMLLRTKEALRQELAEAGALIGRPVMSYDTHEVYTAEGVLVSDAEIFQEDRALQEDRRRKIERLKIKLEEAGGGNSAEVMKESAETSERDQFLARELADLAASTESLQALITELTDTLQVRFSEGIDKINTEFDAFFKLMFGGGSASLTYVAAQKARMGDNGEEAEQEEGIDIAISLPHKRIKGLHMLSGGERALTSIALIFAMSQVNPPPFLILDETDAALDEANSRRYGDMISSLASRSQLILITHNRETMSRAGVLYGVTMGSEGISRLLSVRFEEALAVAK